MLRESLAHNAPLSAMHALVNGVVGIEDFGEVWVGSVSVALLKILPLAIDAYLKRT